MSERSGRNTADRAVPSLRVREVVPSDTDALIVLWRDCGLTRPWNDPRRDIERRRALDDGLFLAGVAGTGDAERLVASAMGGYDGHRGWVYYVAAHPEHRGCGHGRTLMHALEAKLLERGCPKINLQVRGGNAEALAFYARIGYATDDVASLGKRLIPDD